MQLYNAHQEKNTGYSTDFYGEVEVYPPLNEKEIEFLNRARKAYVFRYGYLPDMTEAYIKRKGGKVVSGNLKVSLTV